MKKAAGTPERLVQDGPTEPPAGNAVCFAAASATSGPAQASGGRGAGRGSSFRFIRRCATTAAT